MQIFRSCFRRIKNKKLMLLRLTDLYCSAKVRVKTTTAPLFVLTTKSLSTYFQKVECQIFVLRISLMGHPEKTSDFFWPFLIPPPPCWKFDPDLPNFYLLVSCNIGISDPTTRRILWMAPGCIYFLSQNRYGQKK